MGRVKLVKRDIGRSCNLVKTMGPRKGLDKRRSSKSLSCRWELDKPQLLMSVEGNR